MFPLPLLSELSNKLSISHVTGGGKRFLVVVRVEVVKVLIVNLITLLELVTLKRDTHGLSWVLQLVDLVLLLAQPRHIALFQYDRVSDLYRLPVILNGIIPRALNTAVQHLDDGGRLAVVVDGRGVAWGPDFHDVRDTRGVALVGNGLELKNGKL